MWKDFIDWLESNLISCHYVKYIGYECPGCGLQRSIIALLKGNIIESWHFYPPLLPLLALFIFLIIHLFKKFENGGNVVKYLFIFFTSCMLLNYIYKILFVGIKV